MICRLCLKCSNDYLELFDENGLFLNLATIVSKYFWFRPFKDDPISRIICNNCWDNLNNFDIFYTTIEKAQQKLSSVLENNVETNENITKNDIDYSSDKDNNMDIKYSETILKLENDSLDFDESYSNNFSDNDENSDSNDEKCLPKLNELLIDPLNKMDNETKESESESQKSSTSSSKKGLKLKTNKNNKQIIKLTEESEFDKTIASYLKLSCDECFEEFPKFILLQRHIRTKHNRRGYITCCNKKIYKRSFLLQHINLHLNPDYFRCEKCNKSYRSKQSLDSHNLMQHQTNESKLYKCELCPRKYAKKYLAAQHFKISHSGIQKSWKCDICAKSFATKNRMMTHLNYMHKNAYSKMCDICAKVCRSKSIFDSHILEHKGVTKPKVQCELCSAWLKNSLSLKKHITRHKEESLNFICNLCGKVAPSKSALRGHVRYVHAEAIHQCNICEKSFKKLIGLKEHMSTHTGESLYTCALCPKTFKSNANMWSHKKKIHRTEWEYDRKNRRAPPQTK